MVRMIVEPEELVATNRAFYSRFEIELRTSRSREEAYDKTVYVYESKGYKVPFTSFNSFKSAYYRDIIHTRKSF